MDRVQSQMRQMSFNQKATRKEVQFVQKSRFAAIENLEDDDHLTQERSLYQHIEPVHFDMRVKEHVRFDRGALGTNKVETSGSRKASFEKLEGSKSRDTYKLKGKENYQPNSIGPKAEVGP